MPGAWRDGLYKKQIEDKKKEMAHTKTSELKGIIGHSCKCDPPHLGMVVFEEDHHHYIDADYKYTEPEGGMKNDRDKPDWSLIPLKTIEGIVEVLTYGAKKYARDNWQKVSVNRNFAALLRHLTKWQAGEEIDPESGLHHLDHALCDLMFMKWKITAR